MIGFFKPSEIAKVHQPESKLPKCGACGFFKHCNSPKIPVYGEGRKSILIISSAPGEEEDTQGRQYVGPIGRFVKRELSLIGIDVHKDCWLTYSMICKPQKLAPKMIEVAVASCRPNIQNTIQRLQPKAILLLGGDAVSSAIPLFWKSPAASFERWVGLSIPAQIHNTWLLPTYNPSYVLKEQDRNKNELPLKNFRKHLAQLNERIERPWKTVPDWRTSIEMFIDSTAGVFEALSKFSSSDRPCAFDFECEMLKPEGGGQVICCSVSDGRRTIAYPITPDTKEATKKFLLSPVPKVAANMKFEARWSKKFFGTAPRNLIFDTMIAAHILDPRRNNKSLKFQSMAYLGLPLWNSHLDSFLESTETMKPNKILTHISLRDLLLYNGLDSLVTWKLYKLFSKKIGMPDA